MRIPLSSASSKASKRTTPSPFLRRLRIRPEREFSFVIDVSDRVFKVVTSSPAPLTMPCLVDALNDSRDVYDFIRQVPMAYQMQVNGTTLGDGGCRKQKRKKKLKPPCPRTSLDISLFQPQLPRQTPPLFPSMLSPTRRVTRATSRLAGAVPVLPPPTRRLLLLLSPSLNTDSSPLRRTLRQQHSPLSQPLDDTSVWETRLCPPLHVIGSTGRLPPRCHPHSSSFRDSILASAQNLCLPCHVPGPLPARLSVILLADVDAARAHVTNLLATLPSSPCALPSKSLPSPSFSSPSPSAESRSDDALRNNVPVHHLLPLVSTWRMLSFVQARPVRHPSAGPSAHPSSDTILFYAYSSSPSHPVLPVPDFYHALCIS
ncbi:hypothetical protein Hypma_004132 [Hypsizygus marmoreus]|uniref:Kinetochore protein SPC25 n=1 Tax=Hypsizygus marmoreus TaxID=39966 RepID=A0A369J4M2_HYPMA|nr:hypothetical protein Hypma_004132 [Hypsizygus marmoreus]